MSNFNNPYLKSKNYRVIPESVINNLTENPNLSPFDVVVWFKLFSKCYFNDGLTIKLERGMQELSEILKLHRVAVHRSIKKLQDSGNVLVEKKTPRSHCIYISTPFIPEYEDNYTDEKNEMVLQIGTRSVTSRNTEVLQIATRSVTNSDTEVLQIATRSVTNSDTTPYIYYCKLQKKYYYETATKKTYLEEDYGDALKLLDFFNKKTNKTLKPIKKNLDVMNKRILEGFEPQKIKSMIALKTRQFSNPNNKNDMKPYLTINTLFGDKHFIDYMGELREIGITKIIDYYSNGNYSNYSISSFWKKEIRNEQFINGIIDDLVNTHGFTIKQAIDAVNIAGMNKAYECP